MTRWWIPVGLIGFACVTTPAFAGLPSPATQSATENEAVEAALGRLTSDIERVQANLTRKQQTGSRLIRELAAIERQIGLQQQDIQRLNHTLKQHHRKMSGLNRKKEQLEHTMLEQQAALNEQIRTQQRFQKKERLSLLLSANALHDLDKYALYYEHFYRARDELMQTLGLELDELKVIYAAIKQEKLTYHKQLATKQQMQKELLSAQGQRQKVLTQLKKKTQSAQNELSALLQEQQQLQALLGELSDTLSQHDLSQVDAHLRPIWERQGALAWPVAEGNQFYKRLAKNQAKKMIFPVKAGDPVRAIHPGRVVFAEWLRGFGLLTIIDHRDGVMSLYGNNASLLKPVGSRVVAGEQIAVAGQSGGFTQPGLYFEIRHNGQPQPLAQWLAAK